MENKNINFLLIGMLFLFQLTGCDKKEDISITIKNSLNIDRLETIELEASDFKELIDVYGDDQLVIVNKKTQELLLNQWIDLDGDGKNDQWIFQTKIAANASLEFVVRPLKDEENQPTSSITTYSRFVPERTDDYTWENDRVAFRTFGPDAQQRTENNLKGGTLTSGIDAWLKRVEYPIINKWYKNNLEKPGAYHKDSGEGYDPYHVGPSRGVGGIGFWVNDSLYTSKNFSAYKTIAEGPIRTVFQLDYQPWDVDGKSISETKIISLDLGSNLTHFNSSFKVDDNDIPAAGIGLTLHNKKGKSFINTQKGVFSYIEDIDDEMLGVGIVISPQSIEKAFDNKKEYKDGSHLLVVTKAEKTVDYYAGFGWGRSKQFNSAEEWNSYLETFAKRIQNPLEIEIYK
ncbi:DUF4861 domain-containing protein [Flammeovirga yaeyamensis]|uniref:DUF4861 domain-containing protein n=1 Tax=Flammeovirga yaeyamensis TaxID=367791 RepID=A0AAX1N769_9BACT|nr:DUF4861 domain-containing protein [Flammeovirga yaeyamensis]MBB3700748.1 hypothetical protein [Flammeovirga yaeyamensis]QWG01743.1 DUF4861 domain-containing protein [Flammeovirga yaeyamensis]